MTSVEEATCAVLAAREVGAELSVEVDVMATMTFTETPKGYRTFMGVDCAVAVEKLGEAGADVLGSNCGNGIEQMVPIAGEFRRLSDRPILIQANAGLPQLENGVTVFGQSPEHMARWVPQLVEAGASIIGGCCGTTPEHIRQIRSQVDRLLQGT
jgi:5-methyltetrahydrofolate--homocysteine methyltransferase